MSRFDTEVFSSIAASLEKIANPLITSTCPIPSPRSSSHISIMVRFHLSVLVIGPTTRTCLGATMVTASL